MIQRIDPQRTIIETTSNPPTHAQLAELARQGGARADDPALLWYVVYSKPQCEPLALLNLLKRGYAAWLPLCTVPTTAKGKPATRRVPFFSRYLFAGRRPDQAVGPIFSCIGVAGVVSFGDQPTVVGRDFLDEVAAELDKHQAQQASKPSGPVLIPGQYAEVTDGPFIGLQGLCLMSSIERVQLLIHVVRSAARVSVKAEHVKPVEEYVPAADTQPIDSTAPLVDDRRPSRLASTSRADAIQNPRHR